MAFSTTESRQAMNMKKIDSVWNICRDGWVFEVATGDEVSFYLFGMSNTSFCAILLN